MEDDSFLFDQQNFTAEEWALFCALFGLSPEEAESIVLSEKECKELL